MSGRVLSCVFLISCFLAIHGKSLEPMQKPASKPSVAVQDQVRMHMDIREDDVMTSEDIELNYVENYVRLYTPGSHGATPSVLIHDYHRDLTLYKNSGRCFMVTGFTDLPETLQDWEAVQDPENKDTVNMMSSEDNPIYFLQELAFSANKTSLPTVMQNECPGVVNVAHSTEVSEMPPGARLTGEFFEPRSDVAHRQKRGFIGIRVRFRIGRFRVTISAGISF